MSDLDKWTKTSMEAQDRLFRRIDKDGHYISHQAIQGFAPFRILQYCEAYLLLSILDKLHFDSFIDIGCAEGFYPRLASVRYNIDAYGIDLSVSAIHRMRDYHKLEGICADAHSLPIKSKSFDVVLCSNTMEHVSHPDQVISELLRIAKKHVLIGVPQALTKKELANFSPDYNAQRDQHVHLFTTSTFRQILPANHPTSIHYACSLPLLAFNALYKRTIGRISNCLPLVKFLLHIDRLGCKLSAKRTIHMLAQVDLAKDNASPQKNQEKRSNILDFILKEIYEINSRDLDSNVLNLGTDDSQEWREYIVKSSEKNGQFGRTVSPEVMEFLACPKCKSDVILQNNTLICQSCGSTYDVENGVPILHHI